ncbi:MAG: DUF3019 domain-containing protein [Colwelliaceae bacterium]|jgi:hypothetical protein|nr:DUF3019 domain-containing protein [Colwelliaceae bacterium]
MYFKLGNGTAWLKLVILSVFILMTTNTIAQENNQNILTSTTTLSATPANCVALHQGRKCYASVYLLWQVPQQGDFCIYQKVSNKIIQCWKNSKGSQVLFEFESSEKLEYQLVSIDKNIVLAETSVDVSWVHKATPRKRRWRLF